MAHSPTLALVVIARDEARCLARCLESAKPWVDEMVVLDTGSTDDTVAIARACGANVFSMIWPHNFAVARNQSLAHSQSDWNLVMDADEWIAEGAHSLRAALLEPALGVVCVRSDFVVDGVAAQEQSWITRLLPRGVRYHGAVHEQPVSDLPRMRLPLVLGHDGYTPAPKAAKQGRNRQLLERELALRPDDPYLLYQLGKDFEMYGEFARATTSYLAAQRMTQPMDGHAHDLVIRTLHGLGKVGRLDEALQMAEQAMAQWEQSPDFFFALGNLLLDKAQLEPARAFDHWLPMAVAAWTRCLEIGERPELSGSVAGRGSRLAAHNLAVVLEGLGDGEQARHFRQLAQG